MVVQLTSGNNWKDPLSAITVNFKNYKVTRLVMRKSIVIDGALTVTNVSGGRAFLDVNVVHKMETNTYGLNITFRDDTVGNSKQVTWYLSNKRTFTNMSGILAVSIEGTGTADGNSNLLVWGKNRNSNDFYTQISSPIVYNAMGSNKCPGLFISGLKSFKGLTHEMSLTLGLDKDGNPVDQGSSNCPSFYKIVWPTASAPFILPY